MPPSLILSFCLDLPWSPEPCAGLARACPVASASAPPAASTAGAAAGAKACWRKPWAISQEMPRSTWTLNNRVGAPVRSSRLITCTGLRVWCHACLPLLEHVVLALAPTICPTDCNEASQWLLMQADAASCSACICACMLKAVVRGMVMHCRLDETLHLECHLASAGGVGRLPIRCRVMMHNSSYTATGKKGYMMPQYNGA